ncbi:ubiquitin carboxyl-terminal hydrolase like protein [Babesia gibsoni]|uniref:ubiquitinyl hydrolase 1 n=1 Tax=Babesia gibsoni TaxID=33632 RepID=A0AAD8PG12_BABGI|nr:ubiquitin carboxyl-terminal hydrolase like protein [Babesia gibsoni]
MAVDGSSKSRFVIHLHDRNINFVKSKIDEKSKDASFFQDGKVKRNGKPEESKESPRKPLQNALSLIATLQGSDANGVNKLPNSKCNEMFNQMAGGLHNPGINICFINVIIQVLVHSPYVAPALLKSAHSKVCQNAKRRIVCILCTLEVHTKKALNSRSILNNPFVHMIQKLVWKQYQIGRQEDSFIFLKHFLEALVKGCYGSKYSYTGHAIISQNDLMRSFIGRIFGGFLLNVVICSRCNYKSEKLEPCFDISVDIYRGNKLVDLLSAFVSPEILDNSNKYNCPSCKRQQRATKALSIYKPPRIMNIVLKRFEVGAMGCEKTKKEIYFPLSFSMSLKTSKQKQPVWVTYDLYAVICHLGSSLHMGHYVTFIRGNHGFWSCFNDSVVSTVSQNTVLSLKQDAYLLFYAIQDECVQICDLVLNDDAITNTFTTGSVPQNRNLESTIAHYRKDVLREDEEAEDDDDSWKNESSYEDIIPMPERMSNSYMEPRHHIESPEGFPGKSVKQTCKSTRNALLKERTANAKRWFLCRRSPGYKRRLLKLLKHQLIIREIAKEVERIEARDSGKVENLFAPTSVTSKQEEDGMIRKESLESLKRLDEVNVSTWSDTERDEVYEELEKRIHPILDERTVEDKEYDKGKTKKVRKQPQCPLGVVSTVKHKSGAKILVNQKDVFDSVLENKRHYKHLKKNRRARHKNPKHHRPHGD